MFRWISIAFLVVLAATLMNASTFVISCRAVADKTLGRLQLLITVLSRAPVIRLIKPLELVTKNITLTSILCHLLCENRMRVRGHLGRLCPDPHCCSLRWNRNVIKRLFVFKIWLLKGWVRFIGIFGLVRWSDRPNPDLLPWDMH